MIFFKDPILPNFDEFKSDLLITEIQKIISINKSIINHLITDSQKHDWEGFIAYVETLNGKLNTIYNISQHLATVEVSFHATFQSIQTLILDYQSELFYHPTIITIYKNILSNDNLNYAQQTIIKKHLEATTHDLREYFSKLHELGNQFELNKAASIAINNKDVISQILVLRSKIAHFLGYNNYAEYALSGRIVENPETVFKLLQQLQSHYYKQSIHEFAEIRAFAKTEGAHELAAHDISYFTQQLFKKTFNFSYSDKLFYLNKILAIFFKQINSLFTIDVIEQTQFNRWDDDIRLFAIYEHHVICGYFFIDLFEKSNKQNGAWCSDLHARFKNSHGEQIPITCVVTNFSRVYDNQDYLISHQELIILLHEFGHCLQKILSQVDYSPLTGDNAFPFDTLEIISQLMENWGWEPAVLIEMGASEKTAIAIKQSKQFQIGIRTIWEITLSLFDLSIHSLSHFPDSFEVYEIYQQIKKELSVLPQTDHDYFPNRFSHIFSNSFAAGYYSYLFSALISDYIYETFKNNENEGKRLLNCLVKQGNDLQGHKELINIAQLVFQSIGNKKHI